MQPPFSLHQEKDPNILEKQLKNPQCKIIITTIQKLATFIKKFPGHKVFDEQVVIIFDECHRKELNDKIIEHYYFREIGAETPDRFNFYLRRKMREIMPYYNQLYISEMIKFDPLATDYFEEQRAHERAMAEQNGMKERTFQRFLNDRQEMLIAKMYTPILVTLRAIISLPITLKM